MIEMLVLIAVIIWGLGMFKGWEESRPQENQLQENVGGMSFGQALSACMGLLLLAAIIIFVMGLGG